MLLLLKVMAEIPLPSVRTGSEHGKSWDHLQCYLLYFTVASCTVGHSETAMRKKPLGTR